MAHETAAGNRTIIHADPSSPDNFITTTVPAGKLNKEMMDAAFVSSTGSYPGGEAELRKNHRFAAAVPLGQHWAYKYLLDLDGMGYSGRFMALLSSESAVIKSTVWREFLSDWLQPWYVLQSALGRRTEIRSRLHYIPLSSSYAEIHNIYTFFSGATPSTLEAANLTATHVTRSLEGDKQLQRIARAGRQWRRTIGRSVDMECACPFCGNVIAKPDKLDWEQHTSTGYVWSMRGFGHMIVIQWTLCCIRTEGLRAAAGAVATSTCWQGPGLCYGLHLSVYMFFTSIYERSR